jgi:arginase
VDVVDGGDVEAPQPSNSEMRPKGLVEMIDYAPSLMERLDGPLRARTIPMVLGGDHSLSIPTVSSVADFLRNAAGPGAQVGLVWVDAHPDLETPSEESTNGLNAMPAAHLLDLGVPDLRTLRGFAPKVRPENLVYIGLRDVIPEERRTIHDLGITAYTMSDVERLGIVKICEETFRCMNEKTEGFVLSFDIDSIDPMTAPGVDYPEPGGLTFREAMVIMEYASQSQKLALFELVETSPGKDRDDTTSQLAIRLIHRIVCGPVL